MTTQSLNQCPRCARFFILPSGQYIRRAITVYSDEIVEIDDVVCPGCAGREPTGE